MIMMPLDSLLSSLSGSQVNSRYCKSAFSVLRGKYRFVQHNSFFIEVALLPKVGPQCWVDLLVDLCRVCVCISKLVFLTGLLVIIV